MGTYEHPPQTKDITDIVTWSVDSQNLVTITDTSLVTAVSICGSGNLYASYYDSPNQVTGSAFITGGGAGTAACNQAVLTVEFDEHRRIVVDSTGAINCAGRLLRRLHSRQHNWADRYAGGRSDFRQLDELQSVYSHNVHSRAEC